MPDVEHPVVVTHPISGRKSLFIVSMTMKEIIGLDEDEGSKLVLQLLDQATQPEFIYTHKWREGDLVVWNNLSAIHTPTPCDRDDERNERLLYRTNVVGGPLG